MPKLYVMVALPRSGKSTYVDKHLSHIVKVSADQLRLLLHGRRFWADKEPMVWRIRDIMLRALMEQQMDIVIDETNVTRKSRKEVLKYSKEYGYHTTAIVIKTDEELCKQRAVETGQEDLVDAIARMAENYDEVSETEGFDEVEYVEGN